jgi:ACS family tartrate transporter-like MFS transporter
MGIMSMLPPFWSLPTSFLSGAAAAGGIALINSMGNIGGLLGPGAVGLIHEHDQTASYTWGLLALAATMFLGGILAFFAPHDPAPDFSPRFPRPQAYGDANVRIDQAPSAG